MGKGVLTPAALASVTTDQNSQGANVVLTGSFSAVGPSAPFPFYGPFNVSLWANINTTLTTTAGSASVTTGASTGLAIGQTVKSVNVPPGTTLQSGSGTSWVLAFPPPYTAASITVSGADSAALFIGLEMASTVQLEKSYDGGSTWIVAGTFVAAANPAIITLGSGGVTSSVSFEWEEVAENMVAYRLNCTVYSTTPVQYRISQLGGGSTTWKPTS